MTFRGTNSSFRGNVSVGTAAAANVGTTAGTVAAGDDPRIALVVRSVVTVAGALVVNAHNPVSAASGALVMTLPTGQLAGTRLGMEKTDATVNAVTASGNIRGVGSSTVKLYNTNDTVEFIADSAGSWWPLAGFKVGNFLKLAGS